MGVRAITVVKEASVEGVPSPFGSIDEIGEPKRDRHVMKGS
jgi:hypothetical protein